MSPPAILVCWHWDVTSYSSFWLISIDPYSFQLGKKLAGTVALLATPPVTTLQPREDTAKLTLQAQILNYGFKDLDIIYI